MTVVSLRRLASDEYREWVRMRAAGLVPPAAETAPADLAPVRDCGVIAVQRGLLEA